ncbi:MAG TPA: hypothetical protein VHB20_09190 [Verrucomicrobiae bacterium]|jgi:hypothetical protein|nr:hypothetical protein [Verrucomicrobiae bacterium]
MKASITHLGIAAAKPDGMDNSINKESFSLLAIFTLIAAAVMAKLKATMDEQAPVGYEDENGFHYGA